MVKRLKDIKNVLYLLGCGGGGGGAVKQNKIIFVLKQ